MLTKATEKVALYFSSAGTICLLFMMTFIVLSVMSRAIIGKPILGDVEITSLLLPIVGSLFYIYTNIHKRHVRATLLVRHFSPRCQRLLDGLFSFVAGGLFGMLTWRVAIYGLESLRSGAVTDVVRWPTAPFHFMFTLIMGVFCLHMFIQGISFIFIKQQ